MSISFAQSYLEEKLDVISDNAFSTSLVTYALSRTGSNRTLIFKQALDSLAINKGKPIHLFSVLYFITFIFERT